MANFSESSSWENNIYRIADSDPVLGFNGSDNGPANYAAQALANRTQWLKSRVDLGQRFTAVTPMAVVTPGDVLLATSSQLKGNLLRVDTSNGTGDLQLPTAAGLDDGSHCVISVEPGTSFNWTYTTFRNLRILPFSGETIYDLDYNTSSTSFINLQPTTVARLYRVGPASWILWRESAQELCPPGMVAAYAVSSPPIGWLECNGAALLRATYPALFKAIGTQFGSTLGTNFKVPDLRGEFIRGWDNSKGTDTNSITRTGNTSNGSTTVSNLSTTADLAVGMTVTGTGIPAGATIAAILSGTSIQLSTNATANGTGVSLTFAGRIFGSWQDEAFKSHTHLNMSVSLPTSRQDTLSAGSGIFVGGGSSVNTQATGGSETRPRNLALMYCIKY